MSKLIDLLTFRQKDEDHREPEARDERLRRDERDAATLNGKYPEESAEFETASEYRLASLLQYPHY